MAVGGGGGVGSGVRCGRGMGFRWRLAAGVALEEGGMMRKMVKSVGEGGTGTRAVDAAAGKVSANGSTSTRRVSAKGAAAAGKVSAKDSAVAGKVSAKGSAAAGKPAASAVRGAQEAARAQTARAAEGKGAGRTVGRMQPPLPRAGKKTRDC